MTFLIGCKGAYDDGFYHRLIIVAPKPSPHRGAAIIESALPKVTLHALFMLIYLVHLQRRHYTFTTDATQLLIKEFDQYLEYVDVANNFDFFLA
jgi:hypothetical protein